MTENEMREIEKEDEEEERYLRMFQRFLGTEIPKSLEGILQSLGVVTIYTRAAARAIMWIAFLATAITVKFFFF